MWKENVCLDLAWFILPLVLFGIDHVSAKCWPLTPGGLIWHVNRLVSLWCYSRVGDLQTFSLRPGEISTTELNSRTLPRGGLTHQWSCELGILRGEKIPAAELGLRVGEIPAAESGLWLMFVFRAW